MTEGRSKKRNLIIDGILIAIGLLSFLISIYFLVTDNGEGDINHSLVAVGKFTQSHNDVRRKIQSGFLWSQISHKEVVYEGDSVFTGDDSEATIEIENGGTIHLAPKSLVVIRTKDGVLLDLKYGSLVGKLNGGRAMVISQNGQRRELNGKGAEFRVENSGGKDESKIHVVKGQVAIKEANKPAQVIHEDETADLNASKAPVIRRAGVDHLTPEDGKILWLAEDRGVEFHWNVIGDQQQTSVVEFSHDPMFSKIFLKQEVKGNSLTLFARQRPKGEFKWRVRTLDANATEPSNVSGLTLYADEPPTAILPHQQQVFYFDRDAGETGKEVNLGWKDEVGSTDFQVQVSADGSFDHPLIDKHLAGLSTRTQLLGPGTYSWRLRGQNPLRSSPPWSAVSTFTVHEEISSLPAPTVKQTQAQMDYQIPQKTLSQAGPDVSMQGRGVAADSVPPLTWEPVSGATGYKVEAAHDAQFSDAQTLATTTGPTYRPAEIKPGPTYFRVTAIGPKEIKSPVSKSIKLNVTLPPPEMKPVEPVTPHFSDEDELKKSRHTFDLSWSPQPFAERYELQWGLDAKFKVAKKFLSNTPNYKMAVTRSATYKARVRPIAKDGTPLGPYSEIQNVEFNKVLDAPIAPIAVATPAPVPAVAQRDPSALPKTLAAPVPTEPLPDSSVVSIEDSVAFVNLKWQRVTGIDYYEIQVATDADFSRVLDVYRSRVNAYTVRKPLPEGKVFWRVRAHAKKAISEWSITFHVNVLYN